MDGDFREEARHLRNAVDPVAAGVCSGPEAETPTRHSASMADPSRSTVWTEPPSCSDVGGGPRVGSGLTVDTAADQYEPRI
jgi:hypothetical protein